MIKKIVIIDYNTGNVSAICKYVKEDWSKPIISNKYEVIDTSDLDYITRSR